MSQSDSVTYMSEVNLDLDGVDSILTHPDNVHLLTKSLEKLNKDIGGFIHCPKQIKVLTDKSLTQYERPKDKNGYMIWVRTNVLQDNLFLTWVEDLQNPPSWAIYFGLVEQMAPVFYLTKMGETWNYNCKPMLSKPKIERRISYSATMKRLGN